MKKLSMYVVTHKKLNYVPKGRTLIYVGEYNRVLDSLNDSNGDNISSKNKNYSELTAIYWIWKNDRNSDYVCIEHYRRFFMGKLLRPISQKKLMKILRKYDGVQMKKIKHKTSLKENYRQHHIESDLDCVEKAIEKLYPEYLTVYDEIINQNYASMCNMIVLSKEDFNNYCEWLFNILFFVEKRINIETRDNYQSRVFGFLSERLQNVWITYNNLNMKELPIYFHEKNKIKSLLKSIKHMY